MRWHRTLYEGRWTVPAWPIEYGGRGLAPESSLIVSEELGSRGLHAWGNRMAVEVIGPLLLKYGTTRQKNRFLPKMASGEDVWCLGITERDIGSDFSAAATSARAVKEGFILNGRKHWISIAHRADFGLVLARTDLTAARPWMGLSYLIVNMRSRGVRIAPIPQATGQAEFNEVILEEVRVPAENVVGGVNGGWRLSVAALDRESLMSFDVSAILRDIRLLVDSAKRFEQRTLGQAPNEPVRRRLAGLTAEAVALREMAAMLKSPDDVPADWPAIVKLRAAELNCRIQELGLELAGSSALSSTGRRGEPPWLLRYFTARAGKIAFGSAELHKNIIVRHALAADVGEEGADSPPGLSKEAASMRRFLKQACSRECARGFYPDPRVGAAVVDPSEELRLKISKAGWTGLISPVELGGMGLSLEQAVLVVEEIGRVVLPAPYLSTVFLGMVALREAAKKSGLAENILRAALAGDVSVTMAVDGDGNDAFRSSSGLRARRRPGGWSLEGRIGLVLDPDAEWILAPALLGRETVLCVLARGQRGVSWRRREFADRTRRWGQMTLRDAFCRETPCLLRLEPR